MSETSSKRRGPPILEPEVKRNVTVSLRMNECELAWLDRERAKRDMRRGPFMREAAMHSLPPTIPELNLKTWRELSRSMANLNQLTRALNQKGSARSATLSVALAETREQLKHVRRELLGSREENEG